MNFVMGVIKTDEAGYESALKGLSLNKKQDKDMKPIAEKLAFCDGGHNKFLESIYVWLLVKAPRYWWQEADTFRLSTKQSECYDDKTEVLTNDGWKLFKKLNKKDLICTLNPTTKKIEYHKPIEYIDEYYTGEMINLKSSKMDLLVTPNHNIPTIDNKFVTASKFKSHNKIIKNVHVWEGEKTEYFILKENISKWDTGFRKVVKYDKEIKIPIKIWLSFFGIWLAEGRTVKENRNYNTYIYQNTDNKCYRELCEIIKRLPFKTFKNIYGKKCRWTISNKQLYSYLYNIGNTYTKYIPRDILSLDIKNLKILEKWMMNGDGTDNFKYNGNYLYSTVSKKLADSMQELFLKIGYVSNIYTRKKIKDKKHKEYYSDIYIISRSVAKTYSIQNKNINKIKYNGKIYCVNIPNHIIFVRRNGKATWSGNSTMHTFEKEANQWDIKEDFITSIDFSNMDDFENESITEHQKISIINVLSIEDPTERLVSIKQKIPEGFLQTRMWCMNYKCLRNIILQRKNHRLPHWKSFIEQTLKQVNNPELLPGLI